MTVKISVRDHAGWRSHEVPELSDRLTIETLEYMRTDDHVPMRLHSSDPGGPMDTSPQKRIPMYIPVDVALRDPRDR